MSIQQVDNYFPFDSGSGATATPARWRLMARQFVGSGVIPGYLSQMVPTFSGSAVTVASGAAWIDGFYGEIDTSITVSTSGDGMAVARADPNNRQVIIVFVGGQTVPAQSLTDIYEIPLCRITSGAMTDIRQFSSMGGVPSGVIWDYCGTVAPGGWLLCNGQSYLRTDYASLFAAIGTAYNPSADGTHFNVPDARGCVVVGSGSGPGNSPRSVGQRGGSEHHTLAYGEMAYHGHGSATGTESAWHIHGGIVDGTDGQWPVVRFPASTEGLQIGGTGPTRSTATATMQTGNQNVLHQHAIPAEPPSGTQPFQIMQPFVVASKIIKT